MFFIGFFQHFLTNFFLLFFWENFFCVRAFPPDSKQRTLTQELIAHALPIGLKKVTFYNICLKKVTFGGPLPPSLVYTPTREIHMDDFESLCGPLNCFCMDFMHFYGIRNSFNQISNTLNSLLLVLAPWLDVDIQTVTFVCVYGRPSVRSPIIMRMYSSIAHSISTNLCWKKLMMMTTCLQHSRIASSWSGSLATKASHYSNLSLILCNWTMFT